MSVKPDTSNTDPGVTTPPTDEQLDGVGLIAAERRRQVEKEDWTPHHDAMWRKDQLAQAAASYAMPAWLRPAESAPLLWPWAFRWWKPTPDNRVRELVKAGALIAAEIDRLQASK